MNITIGDTIFFHPLLMHGSGANQSKTRFRKAISTHFVCAEMKWVDAEGTLSESADEEFKQVYNLNLQVNLTSFLTRNFLFKIQIKLFSRNTFIDDFTISKAKSCRYHFQSLLMETELTI